MTLKRHAAFRADSLVPASCRVDEENVGGAAFAAEMLLQMSSGVLQVRMPTRCE